MTEKLAQLEETLEAMLTANEAITARGVVRRMARVFKHATDITRVKERRALVDAYVKRQRSIQTAIERSSKRSRSELEQQVATKNEMIHQLQIEVQILVASHRAMILATAELGGFQAWSRFFERQEDAVSALKAMGAMPQISDAAPMRRGRGR
jgi:hypothetical protein